MDDFENWYRTTHSRVIGAVYACCGDADVAADAADEAFARAFDRWRLVSQMTSPEAWVSKVAMNAMRRRLRRRSIERRLMARRRPADTVEETTPYPEVWQAVRRLPDRQRVAVVLRYVADLTESDIGEIMGIARGTVSATLVTARSQLSEVLDAPDNLPRKEAPYA